MSEDVSVNVVQSISLINRNKLVVSGIVSVDSFDETRICATTVDGENLVVEGEDLSVTDVNLENFKFEALGKVFGIFYYEPHKKVGLFKGMFGSK